MNCTAKITVGILSTVTSILTGCVFMVIFLIGSILLKPEKITGDEKNNFQILCICLCVFCALVFAFMLYASWAKGKPYRIGQIVVCALFFVLYIVLVSFISGPVDIILDAASNLWHSKSYNGSYSHFENAFKCCGYVETPDRCYAKSTSFLYDLTVWETAQSNLQDLSTKRNKIDYFSTNVYDCRQALLDFIDDNFNIFVPLAVLFMLYVLSTGIFFIILLCLELDEKIEAESDDPFENSEDSFFSSSYSKSFNTESEFDRCIKSVGSSPLINGLDSAVDTQFTDRETGSQTCRPQSEASAYSGASKVIMLGPAIDQSGVVTQAPTEANLMILGPQLGVPGVNTFDINANNNDPMGQPGMIMLAPSSNYIPPLEDMSDSLTDITEDEVSPIRIRPPSTPSTPSAYRNSKT